jgi:ubiquitin-protein ligase/DNA-directed RNA polymerase subunit RPC12/RpoP
MIRFNCPQCGRKFHVPSRYANRKATCNTCGEKVVVPAATEMDAYARPLGTSAKLPVRTRRLMADLRQMRDAFDGGRLIRLVEARGDPAEMYRIEFNIRGIETLKSNQPVYRNQHVAEIRLSSEYPRLAPACRMVTPIFHPNIDPSAICVGDHWAAGERLADLVVRIAQMIAYQAYNIKSPLNGEAAMWADLNLESLPIDGRDFYPPVFEHAAGLA